MYNCSEPVATDPSDRHRLLLETRKSLIETVRTHHNDRVVMRAQILIQNVEGLLKAPEDRDLESQFRKNYHDFFKHLSGS